MEGILPGDGMIGDGDDGAGLTEHSGCGFLCSATGGEDYQQKLQQQQLHQQQQQQKQEPEQQDWQYKEERVEEEDQAELEKGSQPQQPQQQPENASGSHFLEAAAHPIEGDDALNDMSLPSLVPPATLPDPTLSTSSTMTTTDTGTYVPAAAIDPFNSSSSTGVALTMHAAGGTGGGGGEGGEGGGGEGGEGGEGGGSAAGWTPGYAMNLANGTPLMSLPGTSLITNDRNYGNILSTSTGSGVGVAPNAMALASLPTLIAPAVAPGFVAASLEPLLASGTDGTRELGQKLQQHFVEKEAEVLALQQALAGLIAAQNQQLYSNNCTLGGSSSSSSSNWKDEELQGLRKKCSDLEETNKALQNEITRTKNLLTTAAQEHFPELFMPGSVGGKEEMVANSEVTITAVEIQSTMTGYLSKRGVGEAVQVLNDALHNPAVDPFRRDARGFIEGLDPHSPSVRYITQKYGPRMAQLIARKKKELLAIATATAARLTSHCVRDENGGLNLNEMLLNIVGALHEARDTAALALLSENAQLMKQKQVAADALASSSLSTTTTTTSGRKVTLNPRFYEGAVKPKDRISLSAPTQPTAVASGGSGEIAGGEESAPFLTDRKFQGEGSSGSSVCGEGVGGGRGGGREGGSSSLDLRALAGGGLALTAGSGGGGGELRSTGRGGGGGGGGGGGERFKEEEGKELDGFGGGFAGEFYHLYANALINE